MEQMKLQYTFSKANVFISTKTFNYKKAQIKLITSTMVQFHVGVSSYATEPAWTIEDRGKWLNAAMNSSIT